MKFGPITRTDIVRYAGAGGDFNPVHHDDVYARSLRLPGVFAMGLLGAGPCRGVRRVDCREIACGHSTAGHLSGMLGSRRNREARKLRPGCAEQCGIDAIADLDDPAGGLVAEHRRQVYGRPIRPWAMRERSEWQRPAARTSSTSSPGPGSGSGRS